MQNDLWCKLAKRMKCFCLFQEFHEMSHGLLLWLENIDRRRNQVVPLPQRADRETLQALHKILMVCIFSLLLSQCQFCA